ncbi:unnamed protein product [Symbiodinium natans]|uniref:Uncharacterized protein n=1 Tax=Symbiodinium natans TaxID=878477 RepID=A0A812NI06_9DINO|nr:unnamed protein product [Symbiodinium natans]
MASSWYDPVVALLRAPFDLTVAANARAFDWHDYCGSSSHGFAYGDCVTTMQACGEIPLGKSGLTISGGNFLGDCTVLFVGIDTVEYHGMCGAGSLIRSDAPCRPHDFIFQELGCQLSLGAFWVIQAALMVFLFWQYFRPQGNGPPSDFKELEKYINWWNDFWVSLCANLYALTILTQGIENKVLSQIVGFAAGMGLDLAMYMLPVAAVQKLIRKLGCPEFLGGCAATGLGLYWGSCGLLQAFSASGVAVAGQHALANAAVQFLLNGLSKEAVVKLLLGNSDVNPPPPGRRYGPL